MSANEIPGMIVTNHYFSAPLDYANPEAASIRLFAREVISPQNRGKSLPWLIFMQGGPGFEAPRPGLASHGMLRRAIKEFRVLLLDQRGTGLSERISQRSLLKQGESAAQASYLKHFRADSIVRDAELIRSQLLKPGEKWTVLGQSFGGFIATSYLSLAPEGLAAVLITGGLPPIGSSVDEIYRTLAARVIAKNRLYYARYPEDVDRVAEIVTYLKAHQVSLPNGDPLSVERFLSLGLIFGFSYGFETLHYLIEGAFDTPDELSYQFLRGVENGLHFDTNPLYALLHEAIYCERSASNWSAARVSSRMPEFQHNGAPYLFTGEMVFPWMFEQYGALKPMRSAANLLAQDAEWGALYDLNVLRRNEVPVVATVIYDDMYVDRTLSERAAAEIRGIKLWITNEFEHDAIRSHGDQLLDRMLSLLRGNVDYAAGLITT